MWNMQMPINELHNIFNSLNKEIFNNELPIPAITIQSKGKRNALGWCSCSPIWQDKEIIDTRYEINICAEFANRNVIDIAETMLHEMVHYYGDLHGIETTSRTGSYHNIKFKELGHKFGLIVSKSLANGYSETELSNSTMQIIEKLNFNQEAFLLNRINEGKINKKKGSIKHICIKCGNVARSTKEMVLICGNCDEEMSNDAEDKDN